MPASTFAPRPEARSTAWLAPPWTMLPIARRRCLVRNPINEASMELSSGEFAVLATCDGCRSLGEHEARAAAQLSAPQAHRQAFRDLLERCAAAGLLLSLPELVKRFGTPGSDGRSELAGIVVRTADRPGLLLRLLEGAVALQRRTGIGYHWHILDDSRHDDARRSNREALARCSALDVTYHDLWSAEPLEAELRTAFPKFETEVRLLLGRPDNDQATYGRPINHALLRFAGSRFLLLDDDVTIDPRRPAVLRPGVEVSTASEAAHPYESIEAAFQACPPFDCDPFAEHDRWLGQTLATAWADAERYPGGLHVRDLPACNAAAFDATAGVAFTRNHVLGDPGWHRFASGLLRLTPETRRWLAEHPEASRYVYSSQVHWRGQPALHLAPLRALSTTTLTGVNNAVLMPPVDRFTRDADVLLGEATRCVHPAAWAVELPFALPHLRAGGRQWITPDERYVLSTTTMLMTHASAARSSIRAESPSERMRALGGSMLELAASGDAKLRDMLEEQALRYSTAILFDVHEQLDDASLPGPWKDELRRWVASPLFKFDTASLRASIADPREVKAEAMRFGQALRVWPELWEYCRERSRASDSTPATSKRGAGSG